jgi:hypothetical protein
VLDYFGGLAEQSHLTVSQAGLTSAVIVGVGMADARRRGETVGHLLSET